MNKKHRKQNQQQAKRNPPQADSPTNSGTEVGPKLNADSSDKTAGESNRKEAVTLKSDWHRPLGIPITEWLVAFFTLVIMASSIVYTVYAKKQWRVMRQSNEINREALESVQRAFVTGRITGQVRTTNMDSTHAWEIDITLENSGTTPAIDTVTYYNSKAKTITEEPTEELFKGVDTAFSPAFTIAPKGTQELVPPVTGEDLILGRDFGNVIRESTNFIPQPNMFVWGWVVYRDVFPQTEQHLTEFCWRLRSVDLPASPVSPKNSDPVRFSWVGCKQHHCTDHDCKDYDTITAMVRDRK